MIRSDSANKGALRLLPLTDRKEKRCQDEFPDLFRFCYLWNQLETHPDTFLVPTTGRFANPTDHDPDFFSAFSSVASLSAGRPDVFFNMSM